jgi:DNA-binding transcriptional MocR family regulator
VASITRLSGRALANLLPDLSDSPGPLHSALSHAITSLLLDARIAPGTRLPSERELAASLGLSRATVTTAYDSLRSEGILLSRTGSGSVAALPRNLRRPATEIRRLTPLLPAAATDSMRPESLRTASSRWDDDPSLIDLSCAIFPAPPELAPAINLATQELTKHLAGSGYEPRGLPSLRAAIADRFTARGVATTPDQILVTNGALHGIDLVLRLLVGPGDRVLTELPTYSGILDAVQASGARPIAVPVAPGGTGWQLAPMLAALRQSTPRLATLIPDFHNPTGFLVAEADRRELLRTARRTGTTVLVDESFVELGFVAPERPTAALDPSVITVGSLSKPVWGGLRVGWIRASADLIQRLVVLRASIDMGQSILEQLVAVEILTDLDAVAARRRAIVQPQRDALLAAIGRRFPTWRSTRPDGGLSLWVELDAPLATPLTMRAAQYGVRIVAGSRFGIDGTMERFLRLPYALPAPDLETAMDRLYAAWHDLDVSAAGYSPLIVA